MATREDEEAEILGDWQERRDRGESVDPEDVIRAHPERANDLRGRFAALEWIDAALGSRLGASHGDTLPPGTRLGPYRLLSELGAGGMGRVYLAQVDEGVHGGEEGARVAVKVVLSHLLARRGFLERFVREAAVGKRVRHPNVVRTLHADARSIEGRPIHFLVMEFVEGQTLRGLLEDLGHVPEELCRHIGREVAKGLEAIHEAGAVHRDLKPENVLITKDHLVKVMDLGTARLTDAEERLSQTGIFVGSLEYAAPEQFEKGGADVDGRADLHALGVVLYELSTGARLYRADDFRAAVERVLHETPRRLGEVNPQVSPFFEELVHTLLEKDRANRFRSAADLVRALEEGEEGAWWQERAQALRARTRRPLRRIRIPRETALVGRDAELSMLGALYERAKAGDGNVVLVEGEAGIGKSRLVDEFVGRIQSEGEDLNFLYGSYPPAGAATASGAFAGAYREHFGTEALEGTLRGYLPITPLLVPAFAALLRGDAPPRGSEPLTKDSLQTVFVHAARALAQERPTVVLIDDLHFAPEEGRALFAALALAVPGHRVLLVGTTRPTIDEKWTASLDRIGHTTRLPLPRLGAEDLVGLLAEALRSERLASELVARIALKSDGNPFFVFEILQGLKEGQLLAQKPDGTWVTTEILRDIQVPSSIRDFVQGRVSSLEAEERDLLDVASCVGFEFDPALLAQAVGLAQIPVLKRLAQVERAHRLVRASGDRFVFDHHQVQEALYAGLPDPLRRAYHAALADALEVREGAATKDPKELAGPHCVDLCEHNLKGGRGDRALRFLDAALTHLEGAYQNDHAAALADRALATPQLLLGARRAEVLLRRVGWLDLLGRRDEERRALDEAVALADAGPDAALRARTRRALGWHLHCVAKYLEAEAALRATLAHARVAGDRSTEALAQGTLGLVFDALGRSTEARESLERRVALAVELRDRPGEARATGNLGLHLWSLGSFPEARAYMERSLAVAREIGDRRCEANATGNLGLVFAYLGDHRNGQEYYARALALAREIGNRQGECNVLGSLGSTFLAGGRFPDARECYERALAVALEIGDRLMQARAMGNLGQVYHAVGLLAAAREHLERNLALAREIGARRSEALALVNLGEVHRSSGLLAAARAHIERSLALAREMRNRHVEGAAIQGLAQVAAEEGDAAAERLLATVLDLRRTTGDRAGQAATLVERARVLARGGRAEEARADLDEARTLAPGLSMPGVECLAAAWLARLPGGDDGTAIEVFERHEERLAVPACMEVRFCLFRATGDPAHLAEAKRLLEGLVDHAPEDCRESILAKVRLHREIAESAAQARVG